MALPSTAAKSALKASDFEVYQAQSPKDLKRVYAFRYATLIEDLGEHHAEADHKARTVSGPLDEAGIVLVLATRSNELIATLRLNLNARQTLLPAAQKLLLIDRFDKLDGTALSYTSCLTIAPEWRGTPALSLLVGAAYKLCRTRGVRFDFVAASPGNLPIYEKLGYRRHAATLSDSGSLKSPMVLLLEDFAYLKEINSPLWRLAPSYARKLVTA